MQGQILKSLMKAYKLNQTQVAEAINVSQKSVSRWITGENPIPSNHINDLAELFNVNKSVFNINTDLDNIMNQLSSLIVQASDVPEIRRALESALDVCILYKRVTLK